MSGQDREHGAIGVLDLPAETHPERRRWGTNIPPGWPPSDEGGGGGGGGGGGHGGSGGGPDDEEAAGSRPPGTVEFAFGFLFLAVVTLFLVFLAMAVALQRSNAGAPSGGAPAGLWLSTAILATSSLAMVAAQADMHAGRRLDARRWLVVTTLLGTVFLLGQASIWWGLTDRGILPSSSWGTVFYSLTGLHFAHVVGGLVFLVRAAQTGAARTVRLCGFYWHLLTVIWFVLLTAFLFWA